MNEGSWISPVQLLESSILGLRLDVNQDFQGDASGMKFTLNTNFGDVEEEDDHYTLRGMVEAVQTVADAKDSERELFTVRCGVGNLVGISREAVPNEPSDVDLKRYLQANALSLGYGKIRSVIEDITAESVIGRVTIPAIDPQAYIALVEQRMAEEADDA